MNVLLPGKLAPVNRYLQLSQFVHSTGFYVLAGWEPEGYTRITR